jgi:glucose/arabinose dehydrogenase
MIHFILFFSLLFSLTANGITHEVVLNREKDVIWGFDFLDSDRILFTEREGRFLIYNLITKKLTEVTVDLDVWVKGQGGLLDVRVHPKKANLVYFTFALPQKKGGTTALAVADLKENKLSKPKMLFQAHSSFSEKIHFGSRIEFDLNGHIFVTIGDRNSRHEVQSLAFHTGKVIRIKEDGGVPLDNPFLNKKNARPEIWALGLRNPQGLAMNPESGELWEAEMGPRGGDEINIVRKGLNYGWPDVTFGKEYWGGSIGIGSSKSGVEPPIVYWTPSISPSGIAFYNGDLIPQWKNNLFVGALGGRHIRRLVIKDNKVIEQQSLLENVGERFRNLRSGPDGKIYYSTDSGKIGRISL